MSDVNEQAERIVKIFSESGLIIELGAQYSVKGQIAQLINGCKKLIEEMQSEIDALKSGKPFGWMFEEKHISPRWIYNNRLTGSATGPSDDFLEQNKDKLTPLFKHSQPIHKPLTDEEIEQIQSKIPDWDDHEYSLSFARAIEVKVRAQYE